MHEAEPGEHEYFKCKNSSCCGAGASHTPAKLGEQEVPLKPLGEELGEEGEGGLGGGWGFVPWVLSRKSGRVGGSCWTPPPKKTVLGPTQSPE